MIGNIGWNRNPYDSGYVLGSGGSFSDSGSKGIKPNEKPSGPEECQTCKNRKYVDGSDEGNVSFKTPGHIAPENSRAAVSAHESMHVANARREGNKENAELVSATVRLQTSVCPECGTPYVSGGTTNTTIKYSETNPYERSRGILEGELLKGQFVDARIGA